MNLLLNIAALLGLNRPIITHRINLPPPSVPDYVEDHKEESLILENVHVYNNGNDGLFVSGSSLIVEELTIHE